MSARASRTRSAGISSRRKRTRATPSWTGFKCSGLGRVLVVTQFSHTPPISRNWSTWFPLRGNCPTLSYIIQALLTTPALCQEHPMRKQCGLKVFALEGVTWSTMDIPSSPREIRRMMLTLEAWTNSGKRQRQGAQTEVAINSQLVGSCF
jgi:hypothetical protein